MARSLLTTCALLFCLPLALLGAGPAAASPAAGAAPYVIEERVLNATGQEAQLPLLVALHYSGGTPAESLADYSDIKRPVRIIAVRGTYPKRNGYSYYPVDYYTLPPDRQLAVAKATAAQLATFIDTLAQRYGVRPIVSGISQGGDLALLLAAAHPASVQAALPFAAVIPDGLTIAAPPPGTARPPIFVYQGEDDPIVSVARTRQRVADLAAALPMSLETFPKLGHDISPAMKASYTQRLDALLAAPATPYQIRAAASGAR